MGEPLMYKDFPEMLEICKQYGVALNLTTNGTFIWRGVKEWAEMILPVASDVKISWNGATSETQDKVMLGSKFDEKLANLVDFIKYRDEWYAKTGHRSTITLQYTFMEMNVHELPDVVKLGISLGVDRIKGHHLWAHFAGIKDQGMRRSPESIEKWNKIVRECVKIADSTPLPPLPQLHENVQNPNLLENSNLERKIQLENIFELSSTATEQIHPQAVCPFLGKEAWVNHQGRFDPCCAPDVLRKTLGDFGNVRDGGLTNIWNSPQYKDLVKNYHFNPLCKQCNMRKPPTRV